MIDHPKKRDDKSDEGPFPSRIFPKEVFPRRTFPWMSGNDDNDDENDKRVRK